MVLLIACPYMQSPVSPQEIRDYMSNNDILTVNSSSFQNHQSSQSAPSIPRVVPEYGILPCEDLSDSFENQHNYTLQPYAVDSYMFPQSQGYAILEKQWIQ